MRAVLTTLGLIATSLGVALLAASAPTGAVLGGGASLSVILGATLVIGGLAAIAVSGLERRVQETPASDRERELNKAAEYLRQGRTIRSSRELRQLAVACGYEVVPGKREGWRVLDPYDHRWVTDIPEHRKDLPTGTSRGIMKAMASGELRGHYAQDRANAGR